MVCLVINGKRGNLHMTLTEQHQNLETVEWRFQKHGCLQSDRTETLQLDKSMRRIETLQL